MIRVLGRVTLEIGYDKQAQGKCLGNWFDLVFQLDKRSTGINHIISQTFRQKAGNTHLSLKSKQCVFNTPGFPCSYL